MKPSMAPAEAAIGAIAAIRSGDLDALRQLLDERPGLASSQLGGPAGGRTPLHVVTDWPGFFPNGPEVAQLLIGAGADVDSRGDDEEHGETPLHRAASGDDAVAVVLIDAGANLEMPNGSIGTPLANAVGYACWNVARLFVVRGATVDTLWEAAALGLLETLEELLANESIATPENISQAFWHACGGGQRRAAERLLGLGADLDGVPDYAERTPLDVAGGGGTQDSNVVEWLKHLGARSADSDTAGGSNG
jgi:ankyrin repeat protein